jgi:UDP-glucose 4-epimerase
MLFEAAKRQRGLRIVFASSGGTVYGSLTSASANECHTTRPRCAYGVSKLAVEHYLTLYGDIWGVDGISLRMGNPYGPGQNVRRNFGAISTFSSRAAKGEPIRIFGDGMVVRDYIYITDLIDAVIAAGKFRGDVATLNIGSGIGKSLNDVVDVLRGLAEHPPIIVDYVEARDLDVPVSVLDISLAKAKLTWRPRVSFRDGVRMTFEALSKATASDSAASSARRQ